MRFYCYMMHVVFLGIAKIWSKIEIIALAIARSTTCAPDYDTTESKSLRVL